MASIPPTLGLPFTFVNSRLSVSIETNPEIEQSILVRMDGYHDQRSMSWLLQIMLPLIQERPHSVLVDMSGCEMSNEPGLGVLTVLLKNIKAHGGTMCLCGLNTKLWEVLRILGFERFFHILTTRDEAIEFLRDQVNAGGQPR